MHYSGINIDFRNFFVIATFFAVIPSGAVEVFGEEKRNKAQSLKEVMFSLAFGMTLPLSGYLLDRFEDMNIPVIIVGCIQFISGPLMIILSLLTRKNKNNSRQTIHVKKKSWLRHCKSRSDSN